MLKATEKDKEFYWRLRDEIHAWYSNDGTLLDKVGLHEVLKLYADLENVSMKDITHDQLQELKEKTKAYALQKCGIEYDQNNANLDFNRTEKQ